MGGNLCKPTCMHTNQGTVLKINSSCFDKPIKIYITDDDQGLEQLHTLVNTLKEQKLLRTQSSKANNEAETASIAQ